MKIWDFAYFLKIKTMGIPPTLGVDITTTPRIFVKNQIFSQVLYRKWPFGRETEWLCRVANSAQDTPMFMSSFAITAIAMDRFRFVGLWNF